MKIPLFALLFACFPLHAQDHLELVRTTPCLEQYRMWFFGRFSADFRVPEPFTAEQCEAAKVVNRRIQEEQAADREQTSREIEEAEQKKREDHASRAESYRIEREQQVARTLTEQRKQAERARVQARKPGARIGMTPSQVINDTQWGRPESVNRTTTARGTSEQWVYGAGSYLYFVNGVLTTIQH